MNKKLAVLLAAICLILAFTGCGSDGKKGDALYEEGANAYMDGDYETALEKLKEADTNGLSDQNNMSDLHALMGNTCLELGDIDSAFGYYEKALDEDPEDVRNYTNLAIAYRQSGDNAKARQIYEEALKIDPDYPELNSSLGSLYIIEGEPEKAIPYFNKAIEGDPDLAVAYGNGALAYAMTGDFETADKYLNMSIKKGYRNAETVKQMIEEEKASQ